MTSSRCALALALALLLAACNGKESAVAASSGASGDIILITIDTWRADAASFAGNERVQTPFLDSLAARGVVFENAHAHNVITLPSHTNILTGLYPYQHGVRENAGFVLDAKYPTVAERLHQHGYTTGAFIAAYPLDARYGLNRGFDVYDDNYGKGRATLDFTIEERPASAVLDAATKWWQSNAGRKRFLWVHLYDPHAPYVPAEPFRSTYAGAPYLGEVASVDHALGAQLAPLLTPDTTVIVTGDHGEALGDHGELTHGLFAYEATLKVPLIVVAPGVKPHREREFVRHVDIAPTILARAGAPAATELPGQSLLGALQPRQTYFESLSSSINRGWAPLTGLIRGGAKYIDLPLAELYDLRTDPAESRNLLDERRRDVVAAREELGRLDLKPQARRNISPEEVARLRALGYVAGVASSHEPTEADDPKNLVGLDRKMHDIIDLYQHGQSARALEVAREVVAEKPDMTAGLELLAFMLQQNERIAEARDVLGRMAAAGKASEASKVQLGLLLTETGRAHDAAALLAPLAGSSDASAEVLNGYGIALADEGRAPEAAAAFERALQIDPNHAPALQNLGILALKRGDVGRAEQNLTRALQLNPRLPLALNTMGVLYARRGNFPLAVDYWKRAVAVDPRQYDALYNIALVQMRAGQRDDARNALMRFVQTAPPQRYGREIATARQALASMR